MDFSKLKLSDLKKMVRKAITDNEARMHGSLQKKETWVKAAMKHADKIFANNPMQRAIQGSNVVAKIRNQRGGVKMEIFDSQGKLMVFHSKLMPSISDIVSEMLQLENEGVKVKVEIKGQRLFKDFNTELETRQRYKAVEPMKPKAIPKGTRRHTRPSLAGMCATIENIDTVCSLISMTGLDVELSNPDSQLILLAPSNEAFMTLPQAALNQASSNPEVAKTILLNHVAAIKPSNSSGYCGQITGETITTLGGNQIVVTEDMFVMKDIPASNGMLHIIDQVLMPETLTRNPGWSDMVYESADTTITPNKVEEAKQKFLATNPMTDESLFSDWAKTEASKHGKDITFKDWAEEEAEEYAYEGVPSHMKELDHIFQAGEGYQKAQGFRDWAESEMREETHSRSNPVGDKYKVGSEMFDPAKADLNKDGRLSDYELARAVAVVKGIREQREQNPNWSKMTRTAKEAIMSPQARSTMAHGMRQAADKISPTSNPSGSFVEGKWKDRGEEGMFDGQVTIHGVQFDVVFSMQDESRFIMGEIGTEWEEIQAGSYEDEPFDYEYYDGKLSESEFNAIRKVALDWVNEKIGKTDKQIIVEAYSSRRNPNHGHMDMMGSDPYDEYRRNPNMLMKHGVKAGMRDGLREGMRTNGKMKKLLHDYLGSIAHSEQHYDELVHKWEKGALDLPSLETMKQAVDDMKSEAKEQMAEVKMIANPTVVRRNMKMTYEEFCKAGSKSRASCMALAQKHNCPIEVIEGIITEHKSGRDDSGYAMWQEWC
jgi:uncharacterized surface protein with fasciclin (FAS1) repeats/polyhydroxyalkanoate synthesis regulator phasin